MQRHRGRESEGEGPAGLVSSVGRGCHGELSQNFGFYSEFPGKVLRGAGNDL